MRAMNPTNVDWVMAKGSDWTPDYLAWKYFRYQPWSFPLGTMEGYSSPQKVSIGLTGAIPLIAVPMKLVAPILPEDFQYYGFWLFLCSFLQGVFAFYLLRRLGLKDKSYTLIGALIFMFSYSMMDRLGHLNLCAHWTILAGLLVYFGKYSYKKTILYHSLLVFATIWIHPYLVLFSVALTGITFLEHWWSRKIDFTKFIIAGATTGIAAIFSWWVLGNFILDGNDAKAGGFGEFSTNLNTFWNPKINTPFLSHQADYFNGQYEGIAYLGIGILILLIATIGLLLLGKISFKLSKGNILIASLAGIFFLFSLSQLITYGDQLIFEMPYSKYLIGKFATLRASGRYVWLLQYLLILVPIVGLYRTKFNIKIKTGLLAVVLLLNLVDFQFYFKRNPIFQNKIEPIPNFHQAAFEKIIEAGSEVIMYPPHVRTYLTAYDETPFISIAAAQAKPINTGHLARVNLKLRQEHKNNLELKLIEQPSFFKDKTIITIPKYAELFQDLVTKNIVQTFESNGFLAYVPIQSQQIISMLQEKSVVDSLNFKRESFKDFQIRNADFNWAVAVKDEARTYLDYCNHWKTYFDSIGSKNSALDFRESYAGIFSKGKLVIEESGREQNGGPVELDQIIQGNSIKIVSASMDHGNIANILINNKEYAIDDRGFNIVVFNDQGEVLETTFFDTYRQCHHYSEKVNKKFPIWRISQ